MVEKSYVIVTNAIREDIYSETAEKYSYQYRKSDLGLIHPKIIDFYSNLKENIRKYEETKLKEGKGINWKNASQFPAGHLWIRGYKHTPQDIPVLLYKGSLIMYDTRDELDYFMISLRENEFKRIEGTDLDSVKQGIIKIYKEDKELSSFFDCGEKAIRILDEAVENQWRYLEAFDILKAHEIYETPMEVTLRNITDDDINQRKKNLKEQEEYERTIAETQNVDLFVPIRLKKRKH